ncbi:hypothetical protein [Neptunitalea lumnitzerae]|uniref:Outer membrane protein beta-barrel domain-containing protein n=1 Tax=Neptunitalea lumnitzerae TaxID=2965509 RepID=A0ABQ5MLB7_9FLAO|nr:hypothetical protein [Neptunitalea sp. Y10]GLB50179.1 hypothetical protein Y10_25470 [Neptunitalea sp. Y10]
MNLNIKSLLVSFVLIIGLVYLGNAQTDTNSKTGAGTDTKKYGGIYVGYVYPGKFGTDNGYSAGLEYKGGFSLKYYTNLWGIGGNWDRFLLGFEYNLIKAEVTNKSLMGNYNKTNSTNLRMLTGYGLSLGNSIDFTPQLGLGYVAYRSNYKDVDNFVDRGASFSIAPEVTVKVSKLIGIYASPELRYELMTVKAAKSADINYHKNMLFNVTFGVAIMLN